MLEQGMSWIKGLLPGKKSSTPETTNEASMKQAILQKQLAKAAEESSLTAAQIGSQDFYERIVQTIKDDRGVHIESLLCALGSLSGYACQAAARELGNPMYSATVNNGDILFFGDGINVPLYSTQYSVWNLLAGAAQKLGVNPIPDAEEMFGYITESVGSPKFGIPRVPDQNTPPHLPIEYLQGYWPHISPMLKKYCTSPAFWPVMIGLAAQKSIIAAKPVLNPEIAFRLAMESAIAMSKVDLKPSRT